MNTTTDTSPRDSQPGWDLIRAFLAVIDSGSLTAAAELLGTSQPTLSRQVAALETHLGSALFERVGRGLRLTAAGQALVEPARQMQAAANALSLAALGQSRETVGTVRISASEVTATLSCPISSPPCDAPILKYRSNLRSPIEWKTCSSARPISQCATLSLARGILSPAVSEHFVSELLPTATTSHV